MKMKFESDDDFSLSKIFNIFEMMNVVVSVLEKNG